MDMTPEQQAAFDGWLTEQEARAEGAEPVTIPGDVWREALANIRGVWSAAQPRSAEQGELLKAIYRALNGHKMIFQKIRDTDMALPLVDYLTPEGDLQIHRGMEENEAIAETIAEAIAPYLKQSPGSGSAAQAQQWLPLDEGAEAEKPILMWNNRQPYPVQMAFLDCPKRGKGWYSYIGVSAWHVPYSAKEKWLYQPLPTPPEQPALVKNVYVTDKVLSDEAMIAITSWKAKPEDYGMVRIVPEQPSSGGSDA